MSLIYNINMEEHKREDWAIVASGPSMNNEAYELLCQGGGTEHALPKD